MDAAYPLTGAAALMLAAAFFLGAWGLGRILLFRVALPPEDGHLVRIAVGTGVLGYVVFGLGLAGALHPPVLLAVLLVTAALGLWALRRETFLSVDSRSLRSPVARWSAAAALAAGGLALVGALLPEIEYDALWYHLTFPRRYLESGRLLDIPCDHMSPTPQHVELLYTYGLLWGDARGAKLIHWGFGLLAAAWTGVLASRLVGRVWMFAAVALFLTAPTVTWEMTTAYNELPLAFLATGSTALLLHWRRTGARRLLIMAAVLLGFGLAGKHVGFFFLAPLAAGVLLVSVRSERRSGAARLRHAVIFVSVAVAVALPWYLRAWYYTGNPLFPMFYSVFASLGVEIQRWDAQAEWGWSAAMARYGDGRSPQALLLLPWRATWDGVRFAGSLGPAWLLFLPLIPLFWRRLRREVRLLAALTAVFLLLWISPYSSFQIRYLVPLVPVAAVVAIAVLSGTDRLVGRAWGIAPVRLLRAGFVAMLFLNLPVFYPLADARAGWIPTAFHSVKPSAWATVLGFRDPDLYMEPRLEPYRAVQFINSVAPDGGKVVSFAEAASFYARSEMLMDYSRCVSTGTWGAAAGQEEEAYRALRAAGVTHILWDRTRRDVSEERFAIRTDLFRTLFARRIYEDANAEVYELLPVAPGGP